MSTMHHIKVAAPRRATTRMLFSCSFLEEEVDWVDMLNTIHNLETQTSPSPSSSSTLMSRPLSISTMTMVYNAATTDMVAQNQQPKGLEPYIKYGLISLLSTQGHTESEDKKDEERNKTTGFVRPLLDFLLDKENTHFIHSCMRRCVGERQVLNIKRPVQQQNKLSTSEQQQQGTIQQQQSTKTKKRRKTVTDFYNQITLSYRDQTSTKSIKIFQNRTFHITGCKTPTEARKVASFAFELISQVFPEALSLQYMSKLHMINATCEAHYSFNLVAVFNRLRMLLNYVSYDPRDKKYPGVIAKYPSKNGKLVTIMIFASGNMAFSSSSLRSIVETYTFMTQFVKNDKQFIQSAVPILSKRKLESNKPRRKYNKRVVSRQENENEPGQQIVVCI